MATNSFKNLMWVCLLLLAVGCKEPFEPDLKPTERSLLVVEGYINVGPAAVTTIKLSRTVGISESVTQNPEKGAQVTIEGEENTRYPLIEKADGTYESAALDLPVTGKYRLHIKDQSGKAYVSAFVQAKETPEIDTITWQWGKDGIIISVNSHDASNNTQYYQWEYEETWEIHSLFESLYKYQNKALVERDALETAQMFTCWVHNKSKDLLLGSSAHLLEDTITYALVRLPHLSERTKIKYSIEVKQHALTKAEFEYLQNMQKNSGGMGSFFDPQPSELFGNIQCISAPEETVVGFIGAYTTAKKRIFIKKEDLPPGEIKDKCDVTTVTNYPDSLSKYFDNTNLIPTVPVGEEGPMGFEEFYGANAICVDCRTRGSAIRPSFWE